MQSATLRPPNQAWAQTLPSDGSQHALFVFSFIDFMAAGLAHVGHGRAKQGNLPDQQG